MDKVELTISILIWDDWNIDHIAQHDVTPNKVEKALQDKDALFLNAKHGRVMILGKTAQRMLAIVMNQQENPEEFYIITARDMSKKERAYYRTQQ